MVQKIKLITIGKIKERYLLEGIAEYEKRIKPYCKLEIIELKAEGIEKESEKIKNHLGAHTYVLDAQGKQLSSEEFSSFIKKQEQEITFIIGGPDGIAPEIKKESNLISLSKMTFLHEMTKLIFLEQTYRAFMIANNRTYHK